MNRFLEQMLGGIDLWSYAAGFIFAGIGAFLSLRLHADSRNKTSKSTPFKFSWKFLVQDNLQRIITGFLLTFIMFRFAPQIFNQEFSMFLAFSIGLMNDRIAGFINKVELKARK